MSSQIIGIEGVIIAVIGMGLALGLLLRVLRRSRPDFVVAKPFAVGYILRLLTIAGIAATGIGMSLLGGDEVGFLASAHRIASLSWTSPQWLPAHQASFLHVVVFAVQIKLLGSTAGALRVTQVGISLAGAILIAATVYDLAGKRAAILSAWLLSLEPASILFNQLLHKEPLMELATGLVVFGGAKVWKRLELKGIAIMLLGSLIGLATRKYVGWFLFACEVLVIFHAALRQAKSHLRTVPLVYAAVAVVVVATPAVLEATTPQGLHGLQVSQNANSSTTSGNGQASGNNLALERVDFSTRSAIITNLPIRIRDVLLRPYPWQVANLNQLLGAVGSLVALACFFVLGRYMVLLRTQIFSRAGPLLYPFFFLLVAYALAVGNAGTGFRYRTHLVMLALAMVAVLREDALRVRAAGVGRLAKPSLDLLAGRAGHVTGPKVPAV